MPGIGQQREGMAGNAVKCLAYDISEVKRETDGEGPAVIGWRMAVAAYAMVMAVIVVVVMVMVMVMVIRGRGRDRPASGPHFR